MPVIIVDTEQAALIETALVMLESALVARTERADPDQVISKALNLQAMKLATVRKLLQAPEPPAYVDLEPGLRAKADNLLWALQGKAPDTEKNVLWSLLREIAIAPGSPAPAQA